MEFNSKPKRKLHKCNWRRLQPIHHVVVLHAEGRFFEIYSCTALHKCCHISYSSMLRRTCEYIYMRLMDTMITCIPH